MKPSHTLRNFLLIAGSSLLVISASATTLTWDADTGTSGAQDGGGNWTVGGTTFWNGTTNVATTNDITTDIAQYGSGGTLASPAVVNVSTQSINGLIFGATTTSGYNLTASTTGQILTLGASGIVLNSGAQATTVGSANLGLTLGAPQTWTNNSASLFTVSGTVDNGGNILNVRGAGNTNISSIISGSGELREWDAGTVTLSGANTYTGKTTVRGTLNLTGNRTADAGAIEVRSGGTLGISNGNFSIGDNTFSVGATAATTSTVNHTAGTISTGTGGTQVYMGAAATGIYNLSGGTLNINSTTNARGVILGGNGGGSGIFNLSGTGNLNMVSTSSLQIGRYDATASSTTNAFNQTGGTANVGILSMGSTTTTGIDLNSTLSLTGGVFTADSFARLAYGNTNTALIEIGGTADVTLPAFPTGALGTGSTATITFDGGVLKNSATSANYLGNISSAQIKNGGAKFDTTANNITITHALENFSGHTGTLTKDGTNTLTLAGGNGYTGTTTVSAGILALNNLAAIQNSSSVSVASGATLQANITGTYTNTAPVSLVGSGVLGPNQEGALHFNSGGAISPVWNAPLTLGGSTRITSFGVTLNQTLGGAISGTGPLEFSSRGGNSAVHVATWTLNAASNYSGNTAIVNNDGIKDITVKLGIDNALPTTTSLNLSAITGTANAVHATFDLNGYSQTLAGLTDSGGTANIAGGSSNKRVINSSATLSTLTINNSGNITYGTTGTRITAGTIGGTTADGDPANNIALVKTGTGTLTLAGANTYTGATTVSAGTLVVSGSIGASAVSVNNAGTVLATDAAASFGSTVAINNGAILAAGGNGAAGTATVTGATTFNNGSIFSWDINAAGTTYDKLIAPSLAGEVTPGNAVFRIVVADDTFANTFWDSTQNWANIFTTDGSAAIADWADLFSVSVVDSSFATLDTSSHGSFSISGSTLTWSAIPEPSTAFAGLLLTAGLLRRRRK